jgi:hypothetical protein
VIGNFLKANPSLLADQVSHIIDVPSEQILQPAEQNLQPAEQILQPADTTEKQDTALLTDQTTIEAPTDIVVPPGLASHPHGKQLYENLYKTIYAITGGMKGIEAYIPDIIRSLWTVMLGYKDTPQEEISQRMRKTLAETIKDLKANNPLAPVQIFVAQATQNGRKDIGPCAFSFDQIKQELDVLMYACCNDTQTKAINYRFVDKLEPKDIDEKYGTFPSRCYVTLSGTYKKIRESVFTFEPKVEKEKTVTKSQTTKPSKATTKPAKETKKKTET